VKKWSVPFVAVSIVILTGYSVARSQSGQTAQLPTFNAGAPQDSYPKATSGQGLFYPADDLKKAYSAPTDKMQQTHLAWTPEYRLSIVKRPYSDASTASAEMHEDKTQIYTILSGTGTQVLGGKPQKDNASAEGQHSSTGPLQGGTTYRFKTGDVILIPPMTWHQTLPDAGQMVVYTMVHIETRSRIP
jgi:mannose-6-phosphate isomerase-like protein (cupin superfamily)